MSNLGQARNYSARTWVYAASMVNVNVGVSVSLVAADARRR